ncbi:MAG TPA: hypothetical protein V6D17_21360 [Candidatus Obscuribacterales bacterium]
MTPAEKMSFDLRRLALDVLDGRSDELTLLRQLSLLERNDPLLFEQVVKQLEQDNDRWSPSSKLPNVEVMRDERGFVENVKFVALGDESNDKTKHICWRSDYSERVWVEAFAEELIQECEKKKDTKD